MGITLDISEGLRFAESWDRHYATLKGYLDKAPLAAAQHGVRAAQEDHPYTDRTYQLTETARALPHRFEGEGDVEGAAMMWSKPYANFVDKGTSRSKPYPFTPRAIEVAEESLNAQAEAFVDAFVTNVGT